MRPLFIVSLLALFTNTVFGIEFINPSQSGNGEPGDFSLNAVYVQGSTVIVQWTPGPEGKRTSLTMFQQKGTTFLQPFEYLTQNVLSNVTSFTWSVQTTKDLTVSNTFFFTIFLEGVTSGEANSQFFNITAKDVVKPESNTSTSTMTSTSSTQSSLTQSSSPASTSTSTTASAAGSTSTSSSTAVPTPPPGGLSSGVKVGLGVGVPAAVLLGISAGWFIFGRRKKQDVHVPITPAIQSNYEPEKLHHQTYPYQLSGESMVVPSRYELQESHRQ